MKTILVLEFILIALMLGLAQGYKYQLLPFKPAFMLFLIVAAGLVVVGGIAALNAFRSQSTLLVFPALLGFIPLFLLALMIANGAIKAPQIHDISTRPHPPLLFSEAVKRRKVDENSLEPASAQTLALQSEHYAEVKPLILELEFIQCVEMVAAEIEQRGWTMIASELNEGWFEAYDQSALFGFKDDIRLEIAEIENGSCRIDMRSVSRVGVSDLGVNAKRIASFLSELKGID